MGKHFKEWFVAHLTWEFAKEGLKFLAALALPLGLWTAIRSLPAQTLAIVQLVLLALWVPLFLRYRKSLIRLQPPPTPPEPVSGSAPQSYPLPILDFYSLRKDDSATTYKLKLRAVFQNGFNAPLEITQLRWSATSDEVQIQPPLAYRFQVETAMGAWKTESWGTESLEVVVRPGWAFRFWIGVNPNYRDDDVRQRHQVKQIGTVMLSGKVAGENYQFEVRL